MSNVKLANKAIGSIVKLTVNGTATEFIVVHQGKPSSMYDESCTGTWLLMKDIYKNGQWHTRNNREYNYSAIHNYLNGTFLNLFDENIRGSIKQIKIPYLNTPDGLSFVQIKSGADGLPCKIFPLSGYEVGWTESNNKFWADGAKLDYFAAGTGTSANRKRIAKLNGSAANWWTRSPYTINTDTVWYVGENGSYGYDTVTTMCGIRPALVLPQDMEVDSSGNVVMPIGTHKTLINGTAYTVKCGKCLVNGTSYDIKKGRTLIGGTGYDITFKSPMPVKGDLITMNLDGTERQYRVLSVNGNVCKVLGMWDDFTSKYNETSTTTTFGSTTAQKYEGSTLDTYLNTTWYNTLSTEAKNAIVPENVVQYCYQYYDEPNTPNTPTYTYQHQYDWSDYDNVDNVGNVTVGERNVFVLDLKDIYDYMGKVCITSDELMTMFWNSTTKVSKYPWLRSSDADLYTRAWFVNGHFGNLSRFAVTRSYVVRPALNLDMSKIQYTLV